MAGKEQEVQKAIEAIRLAEKKLAETVNLKQSVPLLVKNKEQILTEAQAKESSSQKNLDLIKIKFDQQSIKTKALLKSYLELLPQ